MRNLCLVFCVGLLVAADKPTDAAKKEIARLEGEWSMVSGERDGQALPDSFVQSGKRVAKDGETTVSFGDMLYMKAKVVIDPTKKPKQIDYEVTDGLAKGKKQLGIYEL